MKIRKIFNKRKMTIGLLAGAYLFTWVPNILADDDDDDDDDPIDPGNNIIAIHDSSSRQYNKECISCHADILSAQSLDPSIPNVHVAMFSFAPGKPGERSRALPLVVVFDRWEAGHGLQRYCAAP